MTWESRPSPNHGGRRISTKGVVIHSTRGGAASQAQEYEATCNWFARPVSQVSAHRVIGFDGDGAICVDDDDIAWHASRHNQEWLGVELTEPTINDAYSEAQYETLRELLAEWSTQYSFPLDRTHLVAHSEINSAKSDPGPLFDWNKLFTEDTVNTARLTKVLDALWLVKDRLESPKPYRRKQKDADAKTILETVIAVKEEAGLP